MATIQAGWKYSVAEETYGTLYHFGLNPLSMKGKAERKEFVDIEEQSKYGQFYHSLVTGNKFLENAKFSFVPVNALPYYWLFGKVTDSEGVKTIVNMDGTAQKPRISFWDNIDGLKRYQASNVIGELHAEFENNVWEMSLNGKGLAHGTDTSTPTFTYPTSISNKFDLITVCTWNSQALKPIRLSQDFKQPLKGFPDNDGIYFQEISEMSPIAGAYHFQFASSDVSYLRTDFLAGTTRSFILKTVKSANNAHYMQFTQNCKIKSLECTSDYMKGEQIWDILLLTENVSIAAFDGVANALYGLA